MNSSHVLRHLYRALTLVTLLCLPGCLAPIDSLTTPDMSANALTTGRLHVEQREQLASDLARLDQICWFMIITRSQSAIASEASVLCKAKTGGVSDVSAFAKGRTVSEAAAAALLQLEDQLPSAKLQRGKSDQISRLKQTIAEVEQLAMRSWEFELSKNSGWTVAVKARREDELFSRSVRVDRETLEGAVREALEQLQKSEAPLRQ